MCQIIIIPNATKITDIDEFSRYCADILSSMQDGFGYAAQGKSGVFGVRTLQPSAYANGVSVPEFCVQVEHPFGVKSKLTGSAMFHGRTSTNVRDLTNTHPITRDNWHLIHNGVVTDHGEKYEMLTRNDSEHVLKHLQTGGIDSISINLTGYYAAGAIDAQGRLHVFRDAIAPLFYVYSKKLDTPIFATNQDLIHDLGDYLKEKFNPIQVKDNVYLIYEGKKLIERREFKSRGFDSHSASLSTKSLGYHFNAPELEAHMRPHDEYEGYRTNNDDSPYSNYWDEEIHQDYSDVIAEFRKKQKTG